MMLPKWLRGVACAAPIVLAFVTGCGDQAATKPASEPNVGPQKLPGGGPAAPVVPGAKK